MSVRVIDGSQGEYELVFEARVTPGWHLYDLGPYRIPGLATDFVFELPGGVELIGGLYEIGEPVHKMDATFGFETGYYEGTGRFGQRVRVVADTSSTPAVANEVQPAAGGGGGLGSASAAPVLTGEVEYQICRDEVGCIRGVWDFEAAMGAGNTQADADRRSPELSVSPARGSGGKEAAADGVNVVGQSPAGNELVSATDDGSLWSLILEAILWGFAALLTPCVFPMVPMTVSFFLKDKGVSRYKALLFGGFIVGLYTLPVAAIILITYFAGGEAVTADIFNWLATHWVPNVLFFVVFMLFAASLLGAFDIRLPSRWLNKSDRGVEKGGLLGLFFLALTLVLVSFSCTGPIVGTVLIKSTSGEFWAPIITMLVFSAAFALPFVGCALFPGLLDKMPRSGGWLNSVKVVLGLVEIALGLKFLSVADQTYHWGILPREVYLAVWIVVFALLGFYLLGKIRFRHDSRVEHVGVGRLGLAICVFSFVVYLIPGMWGAPLRAISGYLPPLSGQEFVVDRTSSGVFQPTIQNAELRGSEVKYADILTLPHGLTGYFDYEQGLAAARAAGKPVFLDFTGHGCVNCREMEARVWVDGEVLRVLREEYVIVALYSDDRTQLPDYEWVTTAAGKTLKTMGRVNSYLVNTRYGVSAQPAYMIVDPRDGELLLPVYGYDLDVGRYLDFLHRGIEAFQKR